MFGVHVRVQAFSVAVGSGSHVMKAVTTSYWPFFGRLQVFHNNFIH